MRVYGIGPSVKKSRSYFSLLQIRSRVKMRTLFYVVASFYRKESVNGPNGQTLENYVGGGSLIAPNVVLTAAHVASSGPLKIRAGEWDTANTKEIYPSQDREVTTVEIHQDFNKSK